MCKNSMARRLTVSLTIFKLKQNESLHVYGYLRIISEAFQEKKFSSIPNNLTLEMSQVGKIRCCCSLTKREESQERKKEIKKCERELM